MPPVNAKVVTIITVFEAQGRVLQAFADLGVRGFSSTHVEGVGLHGEKRSGIMEVKNLEFVTVTSEALSVRVLAWVETHLLPSYPAIAYSTDTIAVAARPIG